MSGIIGHTMYAILAAKVAEHRRLPIPPPIHRHYLSYLCSTYFGRKIQTIPEATCVETGNDVGYSLTMRLFTLLIALQLPSPVHAAEIDAWEKQIALLFLTTF